MPETLSVWTAIGVQIVANAEPKLAAAAGSWREALHNSGPPLRDGSGSAAGWGAAAVKSDDDTPRHVAAVEEVAVFRIVQTASLKWPEDFWWPLLANFTGAATGVSG